MVDASIPSAVAPHPSVSRPIHSTAPPPRLLHSLGHENKSVLSLMADADHIYTGGQCQDIGVWDKHTFTLETSLRGHTGSILALELAEEKGWLFSASGDSTVRVWSIVTFQPVYILNPYLETGAGDLFSLAWNPVTQVIYIGCQNTSLQWQGFCKFQLGRFTHEQIGSGTSTPSRKVHKFFDSYPQYTHRPADLQANNISLPPSLSQDTFRGTNSLLNIPATNVIDSAHFGYVYCMTLIPSTREGTGGNAQKQAHNYHLVTGSGDETVKLWHCDPSGLSMIHSFDCQHGAVLSLAASGETIYAGCQDGHVKVLDVETRTLVRSIIVQENVDVLSLSIMQSDLYTCSANGRIHRWSSSFDCTASWQAHDGIVLSSVVSCSPDRKSSCFITGANDGFVKVWAAVPKSEDNLSQLHEVSPLMSDSETAQGDTMTYALSKFVSIPSVSSDPSHREDCRQAAIWLKKCLNQLGAESTLLPTYEAGSPLVLGTFHGTQGKHPKPRILFYGHYDVISAPPEGWASDPFIVSGHNGYLYGRGVTDDKGPIMAVACAAAELLQNRALGVDLVFLIEGEEETGSAGFVDAIKEHKHLIGNIDAILLSNSTWISDYPPCITYGLRGVVHSTVEIASGAPELHSGVEGGAAPEPMFDMIRLLATLMSDEGKVTIPDFYNCVRAQTEAEEQLYNVLSKVTQKPGSVLSSRWSEPSLTVHNIDVSGPGNSTVIPGKVTAKVSLRIVPDQELEIIAQSLLDHLRGSFDKFRSPNQLSVSIDHTADWWLGNLDGPWFKALETAVRDEWNVEPLLIREGGSIPSIPYLEKEFGCPALHLPLGQSTDQAHLPNERISLNNLYRGKAVIKRFLSIATNVYAPAE
ncbi:glutathione degradosome [Rhizopogon vinicolor AM-OR11-026]|uniref:Glutathione degradosome n=1 Tax=Rhizopogon vinicolor AM-OR11-026 TaxID=1314800 RepID=A0A1B7N4Y7_9AGAM|nr:glutathione degradosome [Rhizopogon vinicolor AM-OR11-026]